MFFFWLSFTLDVTGRIHPDPQQRVLVYILKFGKLETVRFPYL